MNAIGVPWFGFLETMPRVCTPHRASRNGKGTAKKQTNAQFCHAARSLSSRVPFSLYLRTPIAHTPFYFVRRTPLTTIEDFYSAYAAIHTGLEFIDNDLKAAATALGQDNVGPTFQALVAHATRTNHQAGSSSSPASSASHSASSSHSENLGSVRSTMVSECCIACWNLPPDTPLVCRCVLVCAGVCWCIRYLMV